MTQIAAVVLNSVTRDARVLKEARSLADKGYDVTVFGIQDNNDSDPVTQITPHLRVVRVDWKGRAYALMARLIESAAIVFAVALGIGFWVFAEQMSALFADLAREMSPLRTRIIGIVLAVAALLAVRRMSRSYRATSVRLASPGAPQIATARRMRFQSRFRRSRSGLTLRLVRIAGHLMRQRVLVEHLLSLRPAIVHCHDLTTVPVGVRVARRTNSMTIYDSHEIFEEVSQISRWRRLRFRILQRSISRKVDGFVTVNDSIATFLKERYPSLPDPVVVRNAVLPPEGPPLDDGRLRHAAGVEETRRILLYQGGFSRFRGLEQLVRAAVLLPEGWCLVLMGWGAHESELMALANEVDKEREHVRFIPGVPHQELRMWTAGADLGIIPYENVCLNHWYCSPNKLWEYPAAGVPILTSPFPELQKVIDTYQIGITVDDPLTAQAIAEAVASITDEDLERMTTNCARFVSRDNWSTYEQRLLQLYSDLLHGTPHEKVAAATRAPVS